MERSAFSKQVPMRDSIDLENFERNVKKFSAVFAQAMVSGEEFVIRLEVKGNAGNLIHSRVSTDGFDRIHRKGRS